MSDTRQRLIDAGFPRVAECLDGTPEGVARAWRELARFQPASIGEAHAKGRARDALELEGEPS